MNGGLVFAQEQDILDETALQEVVFTPTIQSDNSIEVGKNIIFKVETVSLPEGARVLEYLWEFGDGEFSSQEEVVHIFRRPGRYNVKISISWLFEEGKPIQSSEYIKEVFAYERSLFLIADQSQSIERIESLAKSSEDQNVYLQNIRAAISLRLKNRVLDRIEEHLEDIQKSERVILWTDRVDLMTILNSFSGRLDLQRKDLVVVTDGNIGLIKNILSGVYSVLSPQRIIITRREALDEFFTLEEGRDVVDVIRSRAYDVEVIDAVSESEFNVFSLPSYGISALQKRGVEDSVLLLVLFLPVIITLITFLRLVIGFSSVGARLPLVFTYSFLVLGWQVGIVTIVVLALIGYLIRLLLSQRHLLYTAKVGVQISFLGVTLLFIMGAILSLTDTTFDLTSSLILVILAAMIDRVSGVEGEKGLWSLIRAFLETLVISSLGYLLVSWDVLQVLLMSHPETLLLFIVANLFLGRYTGLRLLEYFRFRDVLRYTEE
ncbi:MAG: 7TM domain-containing protein [bacterium]|nr:7TM domain-containing protein [bacterium]